MSDDFNWSVVIEMATKGGAKTLEDLDQIEGAVKRLSQANKLSIKEEDAATRATARRSKELQKSASDVDFKAKAEQRLLKIQRDRAKLEAAESNRQQDTSLKSRSQEAADLEEMWRRLDKVQLDRAEKEAQEENRLMNARIASRKKQEAAAAQAAAKETAEANKRAAAEEKARSREAAAAEKAAQREAAAAEKAAAAEAKAMQNTESLNAQRYALYEVAGAYGAVTAGLGALGGAAVRAFTEMESGFTKVERTSGLYGAAFAPLEDDLLQLARTIPTVTSEIQDLASRGAQMGIAADNVSDFTETMAKFIATSPEVDVNSVAESFGRLSNLTGSKDFEALASAIAQVGVNSAATDAQIIKTTEGVARAGAAFGFSADRIIGLSAAMASLGVQPEAARGILNQFINTVELGAAQVTDDMQVMAAQMGMTAEAATQLWKSDPAMFIASLSKGLTSAGSLTLALRDMGVTGQRIQPLFAALTNDFRNNADISTVLAKALADANQGFRERTELDRQYAPIADDLASKQIILANSLKEMAYNITGLFGPALKGVVDVLTTVVQAISDFTSNPVGAWVMKTVGTLTALVAVYTALRTAVALALAMQIAFNTATGSNVASGLLGSLKALITGFGGTATAAAGATTAVGKLSTAFKTLGKATVVIGAIQLLVSALSDIPGTAVNVGKVLSWLGGVFDAIQRKLGAFAGAFTGIFGLVNMVGKATGNGGFSKWGKDLQAWGEAAKKSDESASGLNSTLSGLEIAYGGVEGAAGGASDAIEGSGGAADSASAKIRTLMDYANDLSSVMGRAFDIRFSGQQSADTILKTFSDMRKAAAEAADRVAALRQEIASLNADLGVLQSDINTQEYFLSIAVEYGDTQRAEAIQANLAKLQSDLAGKQGDLRKKQDELTAAQEANNKTLVGSSDAAVANREAITGLVSAYQAQITALAQSGASQEELRRKTAELRDDFIRQATQMGYNREELRKYEAGFDDAAFAINNIPRNVTIDIDANPAMTALRELQAQAESTMGSMGGGGGGGFGGGGLGGLDEGLFDAITPEEAFASGDAAGSSWFDGISKWISEAITNVKLGWGDMTSGIGDAFNNALVAIGEWFTNLPTNISSFVTTAGDEVWKFLFETLPYNLGLGLGKVVLWLQELPANIAAFATEAGTKAWNFMTVSLPTSLENGFKEISKWFGSLPGKLQAKVTEIAPKIWNKLADIGTSLSSAVDAIARWFQNLPSNIWNAVKNAASSIWSNFTAGFSDGASRTSSSGRSGGSADFASGGYTGNGPKYEPAGIVHRGEYVIPKYMVNQSTGLPYADALGKLVKGSPSPAGYANGGYVSRSSGDFGVVDLSASSIQAIAQAVPQYLVMDGKMVGEAVSQQYAANNRVGAN